MISSMLITFYRNNSNSITKFMTQPKLYKIDSKSTLSCRKLENLKEYQNRRNSSNSKDIQRSGSKVNKDNKANILARKVLTESALKSRRWKADRLRNNLISSFNESSVDDYKTDSRSGMKNRKLSNYKLSCFKKTKSTIKSICDKRINSSVLNNPSWDKIQSDTLKRSVERTNAYASFNYKLNNSYTSTTNLNNECLKIEDSYKLNDSKEDALFLPKDVYFSQQNKLSFDQKTKGSKSWRKYRIARESSFKQSKNNFNSFHKSKDIEKCEIMMKEMDPKLFGGLPTNHIVDLYYAKWQDLGIDPTENQMKRFIDFWKLNLKSRKVKLRDWGFGSKCAKVFSNILSNFDISCLDLRKNMIGNRGIKTLWKGINESTSLVHIDLGSNDITSDGANYFFESILNNISLSSFSLANVDGLHRNRIGTLGWKGLNNLLKTNKIITMIDISDNSIGNEGIRNMLSEIDPNQSEIVYINLTNNELSQGCIDELSSLLKSKKLYEIKLGYNDLTDKTAQELASYFYRGYCHLAKLDLSYNKLTSVGCSHLFQALKLNPYLTHLNLESNNLSRGKRFESIISMLKSNKVLSSLNLSKWELTSNEAEMLADGLWYNASITTINLSRNNLSTEGWIFLFNWMTSTISKISSIDLSHNHIGDDAISSLWKVLEVNKTLQKVNLYSNMFSKRSCGELVIILKNNTTLFNLNLDWNSIDCHHIAAISDYCKRNLKNAEKNGLPLIKEEILKLLKSEEGTKITEKQILDSISKIKTEKQRIENDFTEDLAKFEIAKVNDRSILEDIRIQKSVTSKIIQDLDKQEAKIEGEESGMIYQ